jgi:hypothetical protein
VADFSDESQEAEEENVNDKRAEKIQISTQPKTSD